MNRLDSSIRRFASAESDEEFIVHLYKEMLGRPVDLVGLSEGTRKLGLGLMRRGHLRPYIASSSEYRALTTTRKSYRALLGRDATGAEERKGARLLIAADQDRGVLEREVREGIEYRTRHDPATVTDRSLAASLPKEVWLELTTRCNIVPACVMCGYASADSASPRRDMDPETWRSLLPLLRQARRIGLHGAGEPLLYPFLADLLEALSPSPAVVGFNSNGHLLTAAVSSRLVERRLGWISISLDAATARTYLRIRRRPDFDALLSKIQALREIRDASGSKRPQIEINMTLMKLNLPEAPAFVELAARLGLDRVMFQEIQPGGSQRVVAPDGFVFDYREQELTGETRREDILGKARARAQSLGVQFSYEILYGSPVPAEALEAAGGIGIGTPCESPQPPACGEPWERLLFNVRGDAFVCCAQMVNEVTLGRSPDDSLEQIWNGKRARIVREAMFGGPAPSFCRGCYRTSGLAPSFMLTGG